MGNKAIKWSEFSNQKKAAAEKIVVLEDRNNSNTIGLWASQSGITQVGKLIIWIRSFGIGQL